MLRKRGEHEPQGKIKKAIITYILANPPIVEEPILRQYLKEKYNVTESKNIKNHLANLYISKCLKKEENSGLSNKWSVDDIEQFENIFSHFPDIIPELQKNDIIL